MSGNAVYEASALPVDVRTTAPRFARPSLSSRTAGVAPLARLHS